jgi:hypothetical protein
VRLICPLAASVCSLVLYSAQCPQARSAELTHGACVACLRCVAPAAARKTGSAQPTVGHGGTSAGPAGAGSSRLSQAAYDDLSVASWCSTLFPWPISLQAVLVVPPVQELATAVQVRAPSTLFSAIEQRSYANGCLTVVVAVPPFPSLIT